MRNLLAIGIMMGMAVIFTACEQVDEPNDGEGVAAAEQALEAGSLPTTDFFYIEHDNRKCMSPICGGYWLTPVNNAEALCPDPDGDGRCYVAGADFSGLRLPASDLDAMMTKAEKKLAVLHGEVVENNFDPYGDLGLFKVDSAYVAATDRVPSTSKSLYLAYDNGIRCIKAPCYSTDYFELNSANNPKTLHNLKLTGVKGATQAQLDAAYAALGTKGLVIAGTVSKCGWGKNKTAKLVAVQFYLPVVASVTDPLYCEADDDCTFSKYSQPVAVEGDCYCALCQIHLVNTWTAATFEQQWNDVCTGNWESLVRCPLPMCVMPRMRPVCQENLCTTVPLGDELN